MDIQIVERVKELILPFLEQQKVELVELTLRRQGNRSVLKFLVEKSGGITLEDCIFLNQEISRILDQSPELFTESYILEVSSPGLDRPLITERDFVRVMGKKVRLYLKQAWEEKLEYQGEVYDCFVGKLVLKIDGDKNIQIPLDVIRNGKQVIK
jgi:ribosome maturation factor RimP